MTFRYFGRRALLGVIDNPTNGTKVVEGIDSRTEAQFVGVRVAGGAANKATRPRGRSPWRPLRWRDQRDRYRRWYCRV